MTVFTENDYEQAGKLTQLAIDEALARHRAAMANSQGPSESGVCLDCEPPLSAGRLAANPHAVRCVDCQSDHDRRGK